MKTYKRVEKRSIGSKLITTVNENGVYEQYTQWEDGTTHGYFKTTLEKMGWLSLQQFLLNKKGFKLVEN